MWTWLPAWVGCFFQSMHVLNIPGVKDSKHCTAPGFPRRSEFPDVFPRWSTRAVTGRFAVQRSGRSPFKTPPSGVPREPVLQTHFETVSSSCLRDSPTRLLRSKQQFSGAWLPFESGFGPSALGTIPTSVLVRGWFTLVSRSRHWSSSERLSLSSLDVHEWMITSAWAKLHEC